MISVRARVVSEVLYRKRWSIITLCRVFLTMSEPIVTVEQGKLRGSVVKSVLGTSYIAFKGIPFAAPPIGDLRFKDPQPPASWTGIKDTSESVVPCCTQLEELPPFNPIGDEDCLYLNVYTNSITISPLKPVMFWVHGGAFVVGCSSFEHKRPDYLLAKDVVVVTAHYRLGAFGFLNLGHNAAPGNQGLKDLVAALKWVNENIANFGGDPKNVTVFGASAGGALTQYLMLSPCTKGLIHKAIMHSGTAVSPWSINQSRPERCFKLASILGKDSTDPVEVVEFLRTIPARSIAKAQSSILTREETAGFDLPFGINCDAVADNPVMPTPPNELKGADIPVINGYTSHEFIMFLKDKKEETLKIYNHNLPIHVRTLARMRLGEAGSEKFVDEVQKYYFDGKPVCEETIPALVQIITDSYFGIPAAVMLENRVKWATAPAYFFRYSYVGDERTSTDRLVKRVMRGASHVDDISYLFYLPACKTEEDRDAPAVGSKDRITIERLTTMWTNFAKTGNPTACKNKFVDITWKPMTTSDSCYLEIGDELKLLPIPSNILSSK